MWSDKLVFILIALSFVIPFVLNVPVIALGYITRPIDGEDAIFSLSNSGTIVRICVSFLKKYSFQLQKIYTTALYTTYCVSTIGLTVLTSRHLSRLSEQAEVILEVGKDSL